MFRFSSWISESRGGDETADGHRLAGMDQALDDTCDYSVQPVGATKRKLSNRDAPPLGLSTCATAAKRKKECEMGAGLSAPKSVKMEATAPNRSKPGALARMREVIDHQLSLEVLMKHDELRRIDQELAKATVALDQLRRCHIIPFPVSLGSPEAMLTVSTGTGPSIPQARRTQPRKASPFGVTEGPYSRHYASWLIPDPEFDGVQTGWGMLPGAAAGNMAPGRTTRNSLALETPSAKPRRGAASSKKLQALPSGYPPPKETAGPLVLKRADGQWVKLVCLVCQRENFGSTQGFINHCRIAHHREFKSHEEAASQSGQPVEVDSTTGGIIGGDSKPAAPTVTATTTGSSTLVHPLIRSVPCDRQTVNTLLERISEGTRMFYEGKMPGISAIPSVAPVSAPSRKRAEPHDGFVASESAPCLSKLLHRRGFGGNLDQLVEAAKTPSKRRRVGGGDGVGEFDSDSESEMEIDVEPAVQSEAPIANGEVIGAAPDAVPVSTPLPQRHAPILPPGFARPGSSKGPSSTLASRRPNISTNLYGTPGSPPTAASHVLRLPLMGPYDTSSSSSDADVDVDAADLSPATASNKAPSLISDDGEYSYVEDGESSGAESGDGEEEEVEIEEVEEGVEVRRRTGKGAAGGGKEVGFVRAVKGGK
ncbi:hypothetical protein VE03_05997 [Pseudogymnoascus sp. 23342-1-I1]|nr:hypothetical protein VE03_05997 [Pseudogymnoascus sp. 23342-1-I1]